MSNIVLDEKDFKDLIAGNVIKKQVLDKPCRVLLKDIGYETMYKILISQMYASGDVESFDNRFPNRINLNSSDFYIEKCGCGKSYMRNSRLSYPSHCDICEHKRKITDNSNNDL